MTITGSYQAFVELIQHRVDLRYSAIIYTVTPAGRVKAICHTEAGVEWDFPAAENVTVESIKGFFKTAILVDSWTL